MRINFNRDNITKYLIIGGVSALTLITGIKFSSDAKKENKPVNTKNNKQCETQYEVGDNKETNLTVKNDYQNEDSMIVMHEYHWEGNKHVQNIVELGASAIISDAHTKYDKERFHLELSSNGVCCKIPNDYHLELINGMPYAVYNGYHAKIFDVFIFSVKNQINDEETIEEITEPILVEEQKSTTKK